MEELDYSIRSLNSPASDQLGSSSSRSEKFHNGQRPAATSAKGFAPTWQTNVIRRRYDLRIQPLESNLNRPHVEHGQPRWLVFDPISRQAHRIGWVEHWMLRHINGQQTVSELIHTFREHHPTSSLSTPDLLLLMQRFAQAQLISFAPGRARVGRANVYSEIDVPARASKPMLNRWQAFISSFVVYQIRGIQPDRWLGRLVPFTDILFSGTAVRCWLAAAALAATSVLFEFRRLTDQLVSWQEILRPSVGGMLLLVFLVTRAIHELGHALVCKRFGIRCPDIGLFLILGAPCVYCDVTDSWQLPKRWQRAAVAAAGMYVELVLATLAAWMWLFTVDGALNSLALQVMGVCSMSTCLINANPLMRFDGYYLLADYLDEANLRGRADSCAYGYLKRLVLGGGEATIESRDWFLICFSIAGWLYRAMLSITVAAVLIAIYQRWNLVWVGRTVAMLVLVSWWGIPMFQLLSDLFRHARSSVEQIRVALLGVLLLIAVLLLPLPQRRFATGWIQPQASQGVFSETTGLLAECMVEDGDFVQHGQPLYLLRQPDLQLEALQSKGNVRLALARKAALEWQRDMHAGELHLGALSSQLASARTMARNAEQQLESLIIKAPASGCFTAAPVEAAWSTSERGTNEWGTSEFKSGEWFPNEPSSTFGGASLRQQLGRSIPAGTLLGTVSSPKEIAVVPLRESQLRDIATGSEVRLRVPQANCGVASCRVQAIVNLEQLPAWWQTTVSPAHTAASQADRFAAIVELPEKLLALPGSEVNAVFVVPSTTLAARITKWLQANLRLMAD